MKPIIDPIIRIEPNFKHNLWGGTKLRDLYQKQCDTDPIAESWELAVHPNGTSTVATGKNRNLPLDQYFRKAGKEALGENVDPEKRFPILIKYIDAKDNLSVQVHPDDAYAKEHENQYGKNELWYVMESDPDAFIYYGFNKDTDEGEVRDRIDAGTLTEILNKVPVQKGDSYYVKAGTVHAIGKGTLICEIQQSSDVTYRLYDFKRKDAEGNYRELHIKQSLDVLNYQKTPLSSESTSRKNKENLLAENPYFKTEEYRVADQCTLSGSTSSFTALNFIEGRGTIHTGETSLTFKPADTFLLSAQAIEFHIEGACTFLKTTV